MLNPSRNTWCDFQPSQMKDNYRERNLAIFVGLDSKTQGSYVALCDRFKDDRGRS